MLIAGVDEVGRGPLAGPVVAAAVVFKEGFTHPGIKDSKQLSSKQRELLVPVIKAAAVQWSIVSVGHRRIEALNIREASRLAMSLAVSRIIADLILVDGNVPIVSTITQRTVVGGDALHVEISAASILAKVFRDNLMHVLDEKYPGYTFSKHSGYPTKSHRQAIAELGPCPVHRRTFQGVKEYVVWNSKGPKEISFQAA
ncbi:MAG: ribonuclease HII [Deltaproteobacteria bacterium]|nr:ribonuclease HII [Deltaproteobacteria bacterium]